MRKSRSTEEKIIAVLAEQERGIGTAEVCRNTGLAVRRCAIISRSSDGPKAAAV